MTPPATATDFLVRKDHLADVRLRTLPARPLAEGQVRLVIESFALTANNITYAAFGKAMNYWQFFPTGEEEWGAIPVWGFARVSESHCEGVTAGEKFYGYFPMASELVLQPVRVKPGGFADGAAHRQALHPVYNQYLRCSADPLYTAGSEDVQALLRPLFITSFLIDDFLADNDFFGASPGGVMLLSSASSKTAYGTAFQLAQRTGLRVVGLTSSANVGFCESLGCYSQVLRYDQLDQLAADAPSVYIDFAGNAALRHALHSGLSALKYSCSIGGTHVDELVTNTAGSYPPGPRATLFFAPAQIKKRSTDWGPGGLETRVQQAWQAFTTRVAGTGQDRQPWLTARRHHGTQAIEGVYRDVLGGASDPRLGHILVI